MMLVAWLLSSLFLAQARLPTQMLQIGPYTDYYLSVYNLRTHNLHEQTSTHCLVITQPDAAIGDAWYATGGSQQLQSSTVHRLEKLSDTVSTGSSHWKAVLFTSLNGQVFFQGRETIPTVAGEKIYAVDENCNNLYNIPYIGGNQDYGAWGLRAIPNHNSVYFTSRGEGVGNAVYKWFNPNNNGRGELQTINKIWNMDLQANYVTDNYYLGSTGYGDTPIYIYDGTKFHNFSDPAGFDAFILDCNNLGDVLWCYGDHPGFPFDQELLTMDLNTPPATWAWRRIELCPGTSCGGYPDTSGSVFGGGRIYFTAHRFSSVSYFEDRWVYSVPLVADGTDPRIEVPFIVDYRTYLLYANNMVFISTVGYLGAVKPDRTFVNRTNGVCSQYGNEQASSGAQVVDDVVYFPCVPLGAGYSRKDGLTLMSTTGDFSVPPAIVTQFYLTPSESLKVYPLQDITYFFVGSDLFAAFNSASHFTAGGFVYMCVCTVTGLMLALGQNWS